MAYEVTASRRRPKIFDELVGQDFVAATLKSSIETGQIAHAYLFSGPRGCGKTSAARILARSLNCEKGPTVTPCGVCPSCLEISRGASLDILEIDGASNTSVNDVRQIKDEILFRPNGRYKIYIIDEVHMLSTSAFNALLKTIEEPPPTVIFIFATTEIHKVPATIRSRCQQFSFRLIPLDAIWQILKATCEELGIQAEEEALFWIAKESTGSLRDAYTLFDQVASFSSGHIRFAHIQEKLGLLGLDSMNALAEACADQDAFRALTQMDEILSAGVAVDQFVIDFAGYYRSLFLIKNGITRESLLGYSPNRFSAHVLEALDGVHLERALDLLLSCYRDLRYSVSPRFELEAAIAKLAWLGLWAAPSELGSVVAELRSFLSAEAPSALPPLNSPPQNSPPLNSLPLNSLPLAAESPSHSATDETPVIANPGALAEEFKRRIAARTSEPQAESYPEPEGREGLHPEAETVLRVFHGTVINHTQGAEDDNKPL